MATGVGKPVLAFITTKNVEAILALFRSKGVLVHKGHESVAVEISTKR